MGLSVDIYKKLNNFELSAKFDTENGVLALLGASGAGKSMTLKCIAGIEKPDKGKIVLNDRVLFDSENGINLPPQKRKVGYLFQQYALFPNMTVEQNIKCGIYGKGIKDYSGVMPMIEKMGLSGLEKHYPRQLSGGQQQRVALGRILVNEPDILLLDEPFSALDIHLRFRLEREVSEIIKQYGKPAVIVSHDSLETYRMSDYVAVMEKGTLVEKDERDRIYFTPKTKAAAILTGTDNIIPVSLNENGKLYSDDFECEFENGESDTKFIGIKSSDIEICKKDENNCIECSVLSVVENPLTTALAVAKINGKMSVDILADKNEKYSAGDVIYIRFPQKCIHNLRG